MDFIRELYSLQDNSRKTSEYIKKEIREALSAISEEEGMRLSAFCISGRTSFLESHLIESYLERGILEKTKGDQLRLTETGMKAVSLYPLLGRKPERRRRYDIEFFPMILSFAASGRIPAKRSAWSRFFSSPDIASIFPQKNPDSLSRAACRAIESLLRLSVAEEDDGFIYLRRENALSFAAASEESKLCYAFYPDGLDDRSRADATYAISLALRTGGIKAAEADRYIDLIRELSGFRLDKSLLLDFGVLREDNGLLSGADISYERCSDALISSDFVLSYTGFTPTPLFMFFEAEKDDNIVQWKVTKESIRAAFDYGYTLGEVIRIMNGMSNQKPPEALIQRIEGWHDAYSALKAKRAVVLEADRKSAKLIERLPEMQQYIISHPAECIFLMDSSKEKTWRESLRGYGFEMLGRTEGPSFEKEVANAIFISYSREIILPDTREIGFSAKRRKEVLASSENLIERILTEDGIRFSESQHYMPFMTYGFSYSEKLSLIIGAAKSGMHVYAELADRREFVFEPEAVIRESGSDSVRTAIGTVLPVSAFYRVAVIDRSIRALV